MIFARPGLIVFCLIITPFAEPGTSPDETGLIFRKTSFEELAKVVVASKKEEDIMEAPGTVYVITDKDIERYGWREMREVLAAIPNMDLNWSWGWPSGGQRGFRGNFAGTLLLIDGREVQNLLADEAQMQNFPVHRIKRVEVLQGPSSTIYGSNANEGVINIITKVADENQEDISEYQVLAGEANTIGLYGLARRNSEIGSLGISASHLTSSQEWETVKDFIADNNRFSRQPSLDSVRDVNRDHMVFPLENYNVDILADGKYLYAGANYFRQDDLQGMEEVRRLLGERIANRSSLNAFGGLKLQREAFRGFAEYMYTKEGDNFLESTKHFVFRPLRHRVKAQGDYEFSNQGVVFGADSWYQITRLYESPNNGDRLYPMDPSSVFEATKNSLFADYSINLFDRRLKINGGLRFDEQEHVKNQWIPRAAVIYQPTQKSSLKLLYGHGVRAPNAFETDNAKAAGLGDVPPKETVNYELNYLQKAGWGDWQFMNSISGYDMIATSNYEQVLFPDGHHHLVLDKDFTIKGAEDILKFTFRGKHGGFLGGRWIMPDKTTINVGPNDSALVPRRVVADVSIFRAKAGLYAQPWTFLMAGVFIDNSGEVKDETRTLDGLGREILTIPAWTIASINLRLGDFPIGPGGNDRLGFSLYVGNVFDKIYYDPNPGGIDPVQWIQEPRNIRLTADMKL